MVQVAPCARCRVLPCWRNAGFRNENGGALLASPEALSPGADLFANPGSRCAQCNAKHTPQKTQAHVYVAWLLVLATKILSKIDEPGAGRERLGPAGGAGPSQVHSSGS